MSHASCRLCDEEIEDGEPVTTVGVFSGDRLVTLPVHWACQTSMIAGEVARALPKSGRGQRRERESPLRDELKDLFSDLVDEFLE